MVFEVETRNVDGRVTSVGSAGRHSLIIDRPVESGGLGRGFTGGELLHLAVAGCVSNELFREARTQEIGLRAVRVVARGDFAGAPAISSGIQYEVEIAGDADQDRLRLLIECVDQIAEIPNSLRRGAPVRLAGYRIR